MYHHKGEVKQDSTLLSTSSPPKNARGKLFCVIVILMVSSFALFFINSSPPSFVNNYISSFIPSPPSFLLSSIDNSELKTAPTSDTTFFPCYFLGIPSVVVLLFLVL